MRMKLYLAFLYAAVAVIIYLGSDHLLIWIEHAGTEWIPLTMIIATIMSLFPIIPYPVVGGVIGATYGSGLGGVITWVGSTAASMLMFLFVRYGYQDWGVKVLHKYKTIGKITLLFEQNAFLVILFTRLIPIIPSIIMNVYSALSRVSFGIYAMASALGKVPAMLLFALLGEQLMSEPRHILFSITVYILFIALTYSIYSRWKKRNVHKQALAELGDHSKKGI